MAKKEFKYRGKSMEELKAMSIPDFVQIATSDLRRKFARGLTEQEKKLLKRIEDGDKNIKTHIRTMPILPLMIGMTIKIHTGKVFEEVIIQPEMVGHYLGEMALTRKKVGHTSPGVGATRSSSTQKK